MLRKSILIAFAGTALLACVSCATPGAPLPPSLRLPQPVEDLAFVRKGQRIVLTWTPPKQTTDRQAVRNAGPTYVCRAIGEYPINGCVQLVKRIEPGQAATVSTARGESQVVFEDVITPEMASAGSFATYAIEVFNDRNRAAGLSNQVRVSLAPALQAVSDLRGEVVRHGVQLEWTAAQTPSSSNGSGFFYRVYRRVAGQPNFSVVQEVPITKRQLSVVDTSFEWENRYEYKVVGVTTIQQPGAASLEIEGEDSPLAAVNAHDRFAPEQPSGVQAVFSGPGQKPFIDLTWAPNTESDVAGYNVWRTTSTGEPQRINTELVKTPSFRDENVAEGQTYIYAVSAVDLRGNESSRSETTSESVPR